MEHEVKIAVLDRGWVYVGACAQEGETLVIRNARNIRRWGTTGGLGELAAKGPQPETKLDDYGTVRAPIRSVIHVIDCNQDAWAEKQAA